MSDDQPVPATWQSIPPLPSPPLSVSQPTPVILHGRAVFHSDDGTEVDITEGVQAMYDMVINSLDWTSGFWTAEDARPVGKIAELFGFAQAEEVQKYIDSAAFDEERQRFRRALDADGTIATESMGPGRYFLDPVPVPHDHVFSEVNGRCVWPACKEARSC